MSKVPEARDAVQEVLDNPDTPHWIRVMLGDVPAKLTREPYARKAAATKRKLTPELAEQIRVYAKTHPLLSLHDIANAFSVNSGRVSEAINNLR